MGITGSVMAAASVAETASTFIGQRQQASAIRDASAFDTAQADYAANDATARGAFDASRRAVAGRQMVGAQRAAAAASGIDANSGSAAQLQSDEAGMSAFDEQMIRNNAAREAWGYKAQSTINSQAAKNEADALKRDSYSTLLTGAGKVYSMFPRNKVKPVATTKSGYTSSGFQDDG